MSKYYMNKLFSYIICKIFLKKVKGVENIPLKGGYIVAANHTSYLDILILYSAFFNRHRTYLRFIARKGLLKDPCFRMMCLLVENDESKVILLDKKNPENTVEETVRALKKGSVVGICPEGTRSLTGKIQKGKTGSVKMAILSKVPIVPVGIKGTFELMPAGISTPKIRKIVKINIGKPLYFNKYYKRKLSKRLLIQLTEEVMREIAKLSDQRYNP